MKKGVEAGRYYASEAMRNPALQKKAVNYGMRKARPAIEKVRSELITMTSFLQESGQTSGIRLMEPIWMVRGLPFIRRLESSLPLKKVEPSLPGHNYTGPCNPLEQQLKYNPRTGEIIEIYQQSTGSTDAVVMQHDVDYSHCVFRQQKYGEHEKNVKTTQTAKWSSHLIQLHGKADNACSRA